MLVLIPGVQLIVGEGSSPCVGSRFAVISGMISDESLEILMMVGETVGHIVFVVHISFRTEIHQEDEHNGHENNGRTPRVLSPATSHSNTRLRTDFRVRWIEETAGRLVSVESKR